MRKQIFGRIELAEKESVIVAKHVEKCIICFVMVLG